MKHFIYTDTDILNSYLSQINDGLISRYGAESGKNLIKAEISSTTDTGKTNQSQFGIPNFFALTSTEGTDIEKTTNALAKSDYGKELIEKILHDNAFEQFMQYLNDQNKIKTLDSSTLGDYVEFKSNFIATDLDYVVNLYDKEFIEFLAENDLKQIDKSTLKKGETIKTKRTELIKSHENVKKIFSVIQRILPDSKFLYGDNWLILLDDKHLRESIQSIRFKYTGKLTIIAKHTNNFDAVTQVNESDSSFNQIFSYMDIATRTFFNDVLKLNHNVKILIPIALYFE